MAERLEEEVKNQALVAAHAAANPFEGYLDPASNKFTYEVLKSSFPDGVRKDRKEYYMSDEEFQTVMGMTIAEWDQLKLHK